MNNRNKPNLLSHFIIFCSQVIHHTEHFCHNYCKKYIIIINNNISNKSTFKSKYANYQKIIIKLKYKNTEHTTLDKKYSPY